LAAIAYISAIFACPAGCKWDSGFSTIIKSPGFALRINTITGAANNGVQIIVETHSDHFLNGVRVATKNKVIAPDKSQIYFFESLLIGNVNNKDEILKMVAPIGFVLIISSVFEFL
jgi:hypothetical protein